MRPQDIKLQKIIGIVVNVRIAAARAAEVLKTVAEAEETRGITSLPMLDSLSILEAGVHEINLRGRDKVNLAFSLEVSHLRIYSYSMLITAWPFEDRCGIFIR